MYQFNFWSINLKQGNSKKRRNQNHSDELSSRKKPKNDKRYPSSDKKRANDLQRLAEAASNQDKKEEAGEYFGQAAILFEKIKLLRVAAICWSKKAKVLTKIDRETASLAHEASAKLNYSDSAYQPAYNAYVKAAKFTKDNLRKAKLYVRAVTCLQQNIATNKYNKLELFSQMAQHAERAADCYKTANAIHDAIEQYKVASSCYSECAKYTEHDKYLGSMEYNEIRIIAVNLSIKNLEAEIEKEIEDAITEANNYEQLALKSNGNEQKENLKKAAEAYKKVANLSHDVDSKCLYLTISAQVLEGEYLESLEKKLNEQKQESDANLSWKP